MATFFIEMSLQWAMREEARTWTPDEIYEAMFFDWYLGRGMA